MRMKSTESLSLLFFALLCLRRLEVYSRFRICQGESGNHFFVIVKGETTVLRWHSASLLRSKEALPRLE